MSLTAEARNGPMEFARNALGRAVAVKPEEIRALFWAFTYFFSILCAYFILRPLRDEMAIAGGVRALPWMFTGTFIVMVCVIPLFGALVSRYGRAHFIPAVYVFFVASLLVFWAVFQSRIGPVYAARAFFIWTSVFNLFVVSVFWSFMVDVFREDQGRRLFGFIAAGGTAGTITGPLLTLALVSQIGPAQLLLVSAGFLGFSMICVNRLTRASARFQTTGKDRGADSLPLPGGGVFAGVTEIIKSPYLIGIAVFVALFTWTSTFIYFQQANIIAGAFDNPAERTQIFAFIDVAVSTLTIAIQLFVTGRFMRRFGVASAVSFLPAVTLVGFCLFVLTPTVTMLIGFQIIRRAANFAITRPGRELLYSVVTREQKYKSKNVIDTVVYRGGDAVSGWAFAGLNRGLGLDLAGVAAVCVPVAAFWIVLGWRLGRRQSALAAASGGHNGL